MPRFILHRYDPRKDSSVGAEQYHADRDAEVGTEAAAGFYPDETVILITANEGDCPCGQGAPHKPIGVGRTFAMGHDARLRGILIRAHVAGKEVARVTASTIISSDARTYAEQFGWEGYLDDAKAREDTRVAAKVEKANKQVLAKATGPKIGDKRLIKVGRWEYTGQVVAIYNGAKGDIEFEYVTKSGDVRTVRRPKAEVAAK